MASFVITVLCGSTKGLLPICLSDIRRYRFGTKFGLKQERIQESKKVVEDRNENEVRADSRERRAESE
jgi:hypothetical protein